MVGASRLVVVEAIHHRPARRPPDVTIHACSTGPRKKTTALRLLLALAALATLFALAPQSAAAGTYVMRSCNVPGQAPAPAGPWALQPRVGSTTFNDCARGGGFGIAFPSSTLMFREERIHLGLQVPETGGKHEVNIEQVRLWMTGRLSGSGSPAFLPLEGVTTSGSGQRTETWGPPGGNSLTQPVVTSVYSSDTRLFNIILFCSGGSPNDCLLDSNHPVDIRGAEVTLRESVLPSLAIAGGTLTSGGAQSGMRSVGYQAVDRESGIAKTEILLDDRVVAVRDFSGSTTQCPHVSWNACQEEINEEVAIDTRTVADGTYTLGARATDAAGNTAVTRAGPVTVGNQALPATTAPPAPSAGAPPPGTQAPGPPTGIHVTHVDSTRTLVTSRLVRYGSRATLRGVLRDPAGNPLPNAVVDVILTTERRNSRLRKVASRTTDANGRFEYKTTPGPSRLVRFAYGRNLSDSTYTFTHDVMVKTKAGLTLHTNRSHLRNGQSVRFHGTIRGNKQRKVLEVQVRKPGGWDTIASVRSDSTGRWSWRYRFKRTYAPTRYKFRARVRTESGFPYATGHSRTRSVTVR